MRKRSWRALVTLLVAAFGGGCQMVNRGTEVRMNEQMLQVRFENARAEELFRAIIYGSERKTRTTARVGLPLVSLYSRSETVAFNAHCNDHIRAMDSNADLVISQKEAEDYYRLLFERGEVAGQK
jgi:hypothetical protein